MLHFPLVVMELLQGLLRGDTAERLAWSCRIMDAPPFAPGLVGCVEVEARDREFAGFLNMGSLCPLHLAIEPGCAAAIGSGEYSGCRTRWS